MNHPTTSRSGLWDVTTYGETMIRFGLPSGIYRTEAKQVRLDVGGAESNVATLLASLGWRVSWFSALPDQMLGRLARAQLSRSGIGLDGVAMIPGARMGTYFLETAVPPRKPAVLYDRRDSAFALHRPDDAMFEALLRTRIVHLTGITPAIGPAPREAFMRIVREAERRAIPISLDINYRDALWSVEDARTFLQPLLSCADLLFCSRRDARRLFAAPDDDPDGTGALNALRSAGAKGSVIVTLGPNGVVADFEGGHHHVPGRPTVVVDRPGSGDALAGGVIDGWLRGDLLSGLQQGVVLAALALSHHGDAVMVDRDELDLLMRHDGGDITR